MKDNGRNKGKSNQSNDGDGSFQMNFCQKRTRHEIGNEERMKAEMKITSIEKNVLYSDRVSDEKKKRRKKKTKPIEKQLILKITFWHRGERTIEIVGEKGTHVSLLLDFKIWYLDEHQREREISDYDAIVSLMLLYVHHNKKSISNFSSFFR